MVDSHQISQGPQDSGDSSVAFGLVSAGALLSTSGELSGDPVTMAARCLKGLPSGYVKIAIENGHRNSGFAH